MYLQENLLDQVFKWCINDKEILSIVCENLHSKDIPKPLKSYDTILSIIKKEFPKTGMLTLGEIEQKFYNRGFTDSKVFERIRKASLGNRGGLLQQLTEHIRSIKAIQAYEDFGENYTNGKQDKIDVLNTFIEGVKSVEDVSFEMSDVVNYNPFMDLPSMIHDSGRDNELGKNIKMPLFIPPLDDRISGGIDKTDTVLFILSSGGGKSTILKTIGVSCSRNGFRGIHFQLEGSSREAVFKYGSIFSGMNYEDLVRGEVPNKNLKHPRSILKDGKVVKIESFEDAMKWNVIQMEKRKLLNHEYDLKIIPFEVLGSPTIGNMESEINKWVEENGCNPDFIIIDSIDLLYPSDGNKYTNDQMGTKARLQEVSKSLKNIATIYETRVFTATQTSDVPIEKWNDPDFVVTRNYLMGDKNMVNPFSYVFSGNRTIQETQKGYARIYIDKLRHSSTARPIVFVKTSFDYGKYVDKKGTVEKFKKMNDPEYVPKIETDEES